MKTPKDQTQEYVDRKGLTPSGLASRAGVHRASVCRWLKKDTLSAGQKEPDITLRTWEALAQYMAMNP